MSIPDVILIVFIAGFLFYGFFFGLVRTIGSIAALAISSWVATDYYLFFYGYVSRYAFGYDRLGKILIFIIIFSLVGRLVTLGFSALDRALLFMSFIPFFRILNRLLGAIFGLLLGGLAVGLIFRAGLNFGITSGFILRIFSNSKVLPSLLVLASSGTAFLPSALGWIRKTIIKFVSVFTNDFRIDL
jgi:hypothetical protein